MLPAERAAAGTLVGDAAAGVVDVVEGMHRGIAARPFGILGPVAAPVRMAHDGIARGVYAAVRGGLRGAARAGAGASARWADATAAPPGAVAPRDAAPLGDGPRGGRALALLHGLAGDRLDTGPLRLAMAVRNDGRDLMLDREAVAAAFPRATPRLAVFVHGLFETDADWHGGPVDYGLALQQELGITPVHVRYPTGLRVSVNGRALAALLGQLVAAWPVPVADVTLVGHSMGGLVARSAWHSGAPAAVALVVALGTPHRGADVEKGLNVLGWALGRVPETRALATAVNARSAGIKDLRFGACVEADWRGHDPDELLRDRCTDVALGVRHAVVAAALDDGLRGAALGDLLVRTASARGRTPCAEEHRLTGLTHFDLLHHPEVLAQLRRWLAPPPRGPRAPAAPASA